MRKIEPITFLIGVFAVAGSSTWAVLNLTSGSPARSNQAPSSEISGGLKIVYSIEDAAREAGYSIATPEIPAGFVRRDATEVNEIVTALTSRTVVRLRWFLEEDPSIYIDLEIAPGLNGLGESSADEEETPIVVKGITGETKVFEARPPGRPYPFMVIFWRQHDDQNDVSYVLRGSLAGPLDQDTLASIAETVRVR